MPTPENMDTEELAERFKQFIAEHEELPTDRFTPNERLKLRELLKNKDELDAMVEGKKAWIVIWKWSGVGAKWITVMIGAALAIKAYLSGIGK